MPYLDGWADGRHAPRPSATSASGLGELVRLPVSTPGTRPAWHLYVIRSEGAEALEASLDARGIGARRYYRVPTHRQPALATDIELPVTTRVARTNLALPIGPCLTAAQADEVVAAIRDAVR